MARHDQHSPRQRLGHRSGNLPVHLSSFVSRAEEVASVGAVLTSARLVTLTGPGGCGKTRLALAVADCVRSAFQHGTRWIDLAPLTAAHQVPLAVAAVLDVRQTSGRELLEAVIRRLGSQRVLLVIDNCEHLMLACAPVVEALLRETSGVRVLATSRESLRIPGEVTWPVPPLSLPPPGAVDDLSELERFGAVRLFVERARTVLPTFALTAENSAAVVGICQRLDGLPLAIELAASRLKVLAPDLLLERLDDCFQLLAGGRTAVPRHRTLRSTMDWSYDLLLDPQKVLFARVSVFADGFTLDAAEKVCAEAPLEQHDIPRLLAALVDKSLIMVQHDGGQTRYRLLEKIRQYAGERLSVSADAHATQQRHAWYFCDLVERAKPRLTESDQVEWLGRLEADLDNIRGALRWARQVGESEVGLRLAGAMCRFWHLRGYYDDGRASLKSALAAGEGTPDEHTTVEDAIWSALYDPAPAGPASVKGRAPPLRTFAFGMSRAYVGTRLLGPSDWSYAKPRELLFFLLIHPVCSKEQIGLALWPAASSAQLRNAFHATLHTLRNVLGEVAAVRFDRGHYRLDRSADHFFDVQAFESSLGKGQKAGDEAPLDAIGNLQHAITLYGGDFLQDFSDSDWVREQRNQLQRHYEDALIMLGRLLARQGRHAEAAETYRRAIAHDPILEAAHRELMRCYMHLGERGLAIRHYERFARQLRAELDAPPAPETTALVQRLRHGDRT